MTALNKSVRRPALRYPGGKWRLASWIISHFPAHRTYVDPYGGAGSVLMRKARSYAEIYNDRWGRVVDVFKVLRDPVQAAELRRRIELTPYAREEFERVSEPALQDTSDVVERARMTIFRSFAGFGSGAVNSDHATGFRANSNRSGTTPAHDWQTYAGHIPAFVARWQGVVIENRLAHNVMRQHDSAETLHYVDPPYMHRTRNMRHRKAVYAFELTDAEHHELAECLHRLAGMVVLSGYPCALYDAWYAGWHRVERQALADGARKRTEVLWLNPAALSALKTDIAARLPVGDKAP